MELGFLSQRSSNINTSLTKKQDANWKSLSPIALNSNCIDNEYIIITSDLIKSAKDVRLAISIGGVYDISIINVYQNIYDATGNIIKGNTRRLADGSVRVNISSSSTVSVSSMSVTLFYR